MPDASIVSILLMPSPLIETIELFCHCGKQLGVHKMIQEPIDLQYAAGQDYPVLRDAALQKLQGAHPISEIRKSFLSYNIFLPAQLAFLNNFDRFRQIF